MTISLLKKIESLSAEDQKEVERFVAFLEFRNFETDSSLLTEEEESEITLRIKEMRASNEASFPAEGVFAELKTRYGR